jgi:hypothetical protein
MAAFRADLDAVGPVCAVAAIRVGLTRAAGLFFITI